jgi:hypothetical protein
VTAAAAALLLAGCAAGPRTEFGTAESGAAVIVTVGVDVVPGTYTASYPAAPDDCYWVRVAPDGSRADGTARTVVLVAGETITTGGCGPWTRED